MLAETAPHAETVGSAEPPDDLGRLLRARRIPALDGVRALAVAMVVLYHGGFGRVPGELGVTVFFVLSGFLITHLLLEEREATGRIDVARFYARRALRIVPAYLVFVGSAMALDAARGTPWDRTTVITALTYTLNYRNALIGTGPIAHVWSLAVEEQFYLLWPLALVALGTTRRSRTALIASVIAACAWRSALFLGRGVGAGYVYNAFETRVDSLATGCLLAVLMTSPRVRFGAARLARVPWAPVATIVLLLLSAMEVGERWHYSAGLTVDSLLVAVLLIQWMQLTSTPLWAWLDSRPARWLGRVSYPLYLWHSLAFDVAGWSGLPFAARFGLGLLLALALATASYRLVERPFLALKERLRPAIVPA